MPSVKQSCNLHVVLEPMQPLTPHLIGAWQGDPAWQVADAGSFVHSSLDLPAWRAALHAAPSRRQRAQGKPLFTLSGGGQLIASKLVCPSHAADHAAPAEPGLSHKLAPHAAMAVMDCPTALEWQNWAFCRLRHRLLLAGW